MRIFVIHKPAVDADNILSLFLQRYPIGEGTLHHYIFRPILLISAESTKRAELSQNLKIFAKLTVRGVAGGGYFEDFCSSRAI